MNTTRRATHATTFNPGQENRFVLASAWHLALTGVLFISLGTPLLEIPLASLTVATLHIFVLGVLSMALFGLAIRLLPLWTRIDWPWPRLIPWILGGWTLGVWSVFLGVGTRIHPWTLLVASAGIGLGCGFFLLQSGLMLFRKTSRPFLTPLLRLSWLALTGVFFLGAVFLGEYAHGFLPYNRFAMVGTHLTWGLFGWVGLFLMALRLALATTPLSDRNARLLDWIMAGAALSLAAIPVLLFILPEEPRWLWLAGVPGGAALVLLTLLARQGDPKQNTIYWHMGDFLGACALVALLLWPVIPDDRLRFLFGILLLPGWALSQLFGAYERWRPGRLGELHVFSHAASVVFLVVAVWTKLGVTVQLAGVTMMFSGLLFIRAHIHE
ncbi:MAG: hypothetical protein H7839_02655 [Magnetococcus sp. YQC-5]